MAESETTRVECGEGDEGVPPVRLRLLGNASDSRATLSRAKEVWRVVAAARSADWPSDAWFADNLPRWFIATFTDQSKLSPAYRGWSLGSWTDAVRETGWVWWSASATPAEWRINLSAHTFPYGGIEAFEYLMAAAGAGSISFEGP